MASFAYMRMRARTTALRDVPAMRFAALRLLEWARSHQLQATAAFSFYPVAAMDARRPLLMLLFAMAAGAGYAQAPARTQPLAPPPPPPPDVLGNEELEPQVTINRTEDQTTEEVRIGGQLRYIRVTPRYGRPFYLIPEPNGMYIRRDGVDSTTKVPMWVLFSF